MSEYLSKEEIKQWRSSLEKITLEEYAARLGKKLEEEKPTNDLVDIVLKGKPVVSTTDEWMQSRTERLSSIAERAFTREREISHTPFSINNIKIDENGNAKIKAEKPVKKAEKAQPQKTVKPAVQSQERAEAKDLREEVRIVFKKALTDREQKVFEYLLENSNSIVYAKDLASLLELPRDYVYKYIKNLRAKIEGDKLKNADKGGFVLEV